MKLICIFFYPFLNPKAATFIVTHSQPCLLYCTSCFRMKWLKLIAYSLPFVVYIRFYASNNNFLEHSFSKLLCQSYSSISADLRIIWFKESYIWWI